MVSGNHFTTFLRQYVFIQRDRETERQRDRETERQREIETETENSV